MFVFSEAIYQLEYQVSRIHFSIWVVKLLQYLVGVLLIKLYFRLKFDCITNARLHFPGFHCPVFPVYKLEKALFYYSRENRILCLELWKSKMKARFVEEQGSKNISNKTLTSLEFPRSTKYYFGILNLTFPIIWY